MKTKNNAGARDANGTASVAGNADQRSQGINTFAIRRIGESGAGTVRTSSAAAAMKKQKQDLH